MPASNGYRREVVLLGRYTILMLLCFQVKLSGCMVALFINKITLLICIFLHIFDTAYLCLPASMILGFKNERLSHDLQQLLQNHQGFLLFQIRIGFPNFPPPALSKKAIVTLCFNFLPPLVLFFSHSFTWERFTETTVIAQVLKVLTIIPST